MLKRQGILDSPGEHTHSRGRPTERLAIRVYPAYFYPDEIGDRGEGGGRRGEEVKEPSNDVFHPAGASWASSSCVDWDDTNGV